MQTLISRLGVDRATEFHDHVMAHIPTLKEVVESESLDCEFELRRTYDVFLDQAEADEAKENFFASLKNEERWTRDIDFIGPDMAEQVSQTIHHGPGPKCSPKFVTGDIYERSQSSLQLTMLLIMALQICLSDPGSFGRKQVREPTD
jgi:isocitrate dehydrogenase kinase/phosphatase